MVRQVPMCPVLLQLYPGGYSISLLSRRPGCRLRPRPMILRCMTMTVASIRVPSVLYPLRPAPSGGMRQQPSVLPAPSLLLRKRLSRLQSSRLSRLQSSSLSLSIVPAVPVLRRRMRLPVQRQSIARVLIWDSLVVRRLMRRHVSFRRLNCWVLARVPVQQIRRRRIVLLIWGQQVLWLTILRARFLSRLLPAARLLRSHLRQEVSSGTCHGMRMLKRITKQLRRT